jgi:hypothetical protein
LPIGVFFPGYFRVQLTTLRQLSTITVNPAAGGHRTRMTPPRPAAAGRP